MSAPLSGFAMFCWAVGGVLVICAVTAYLERRRDDSLYVDEDPVDDPRDKLAAFRRWQAQRKNLN